ncbi:MAG: adenosine deaminase [Chloroflexi bacterium]|nr:adenosine deaminase [Chloroflexota bacterium]
MVVDEPVATDHEASARTWSQQRSGRPPGPPLAELHVHIGGAVSPATLYSIAHSQGIRLPTVGYWAFEELVTATPDRVKTFDGYLNLFHWTELIQSSPQAMEASVHSIVGGGYRSCNIDLVELRYCPAKRNRGGERDLDHIIVASLHGLQRALLEYKEVRAGLVLCCDRSLPPEVNEAIVRKAIRYSALGIVGIDLAGPEATTFGGVARLERAFRSAADAGLGVTVHAGEAGTLEEMWEVVDRLRPRRIGHGLRAVDDDHLLQRLSADGIVLELCPTSNLRTGIVPDLATYAGIIQRLHQAGVAYTINTDGPEMLGTNMPGERALLREAGILDDERLAWTDRVARRASFIAAGDRYVS